MVWVMIYQLTSILISQIFWCLNSHNKKQIGFYQRTAEPTDISDLNGVGNIPFKNQWEAYMSLGYQNINNQIKLPRAAASSFRLTSCKITKTEIRGILVAPAQLDDESVLV